MYVCCTVVVRKIACLRREAGDSSISKPVSACTDSLRIRYSVEDWLHKYLRCPRFCLGRYEVHPRLPNKHLPIFCTSITQPIQVHQSSPRNNCKTLSLNQRCNMSCPRNLPPAAAHCYRTENPALNHQEQALQCQSHSAALPG